MEAAEQVFATDTTAAIAQIAMTEASGVPAQAVAAASITHLAAAFATDPLSGYRALTCLKQRTGPLDHGVRDQALRLADPADEFAAVRALPAGDAVSREWRSRAAALTTYHRALSEQRDPAGLLTTLLHEHHARACGLDPEHQTDTGRLARAAAQRNLATAPAAVGSLEGAR